MKRKNLTSNNRKFKTKKVANIYDGWKDMSAGEKAGGIASAAAGALQLVGDAMNSANKIDTSKADNAIEAVESYQPQATDIDSLASQINSFEGAKTDWKGSDFGMSTAEGLTSLGTSMASGAAAGAALGPWGVGGGAVAGLITAGAGWVANAVKSKSRAEELNKKAKAANYIGEQKGQAAINNFNESQYYDFMKTIKSYGGPLYNHSGDWSNGLTFINEGGTHEENPFDGVLMGFDQEGIPNLVEEGEIIYNDYVFSNRLKPSKKQLESSGLNKKYNDWTFAKIVEDLQKAAAETPLDKISKDSLNDMMNTMMTLQEEVRAKKGLTGENRLMANGGHIFDGKRHISPDGTEFNSKRALKLYEKARLAKSQMDQYPYKNTEYYKQLESNYNKYKTRSSKIEDRHNNLMDFDLNTLGMYAPTLDNANKLISNAVTPVDTSNFIQEEAYSQIPFANIGRINVSPKREAIDQNAIITPIINQGRATARDIQNLGTTSADVLNRLALNTYNTQRATGETALKASQMQFERDRATDALIAELQARNAGLDQAEYAANLPVYMKRAEGLIQDAANKEIAENTKLEAQDVLSASMNQGIADLTRQNIEWNWIKDNPQYAEAVAALHGKKANGGMLTRKKRRK